MVLPFWGTTLRQWRRSALELVFPWSCLLCKAPDQKQRAPDLWGKWLCQDCYGTIKFIGGQGCPRCGQSAGAHIPAGASCVHCQGDKDWPETKALFRYESSGRELIHRLKYQSEIALADVFGVELANLYRADPPDIVTSVPMHWTRQFWRGYNQADEIARVVARELDRPLKSVFRRKRITPALFNKSRSERQDILQKAFQLRLTSVQGKRILVVDDIATTGSTLKELQALLKKAQVQSVQVTVVALTPAQQ
ncbi:MAG: ComF family protein [Planctomycetota bacterium]|nr:ComF family protein [Planctomycetota bacterium]